MLIIKSLSLGNIYRFIFLKDNFLTSGIMKALSERINVDFKSFSREEVYSTVVLDENIGLKRFMPGIIIVF